MPVKKCVVTDCENVVENDNLSFFSFPFAASHYKDLEEKKYTELQRELWVNAINNDLVNNPNKLKYLVVCEEHFECGKPAHITDRSNPDYVPHLNMGSNDYILQPTKPPQATQSVENNLRYRPGPKRFKFNKILLSGEQQKSDTGNWPEKPNTQNMKSASQHNVNTATVTKLPHKPPVPNVSADKPTPIAVDFPEDVHSSFGEYVASMLRSIPNKYLQSVARQQICQTLFKIEHVMQLSRKDCDPKDIPPAANKEFKQFGLPLLAASNKDDKSSNVPKKKDQSTQVEVMSQSTQCSPPYIQAAYSLNDPAVTGQPLQTVIYAPILQQHQQGLLTNYGQLTQINQCNIGSVSNAGGQQQTTTLPPPPPLIVMNHNTATSNQPDRIMDLDTVEMQKQTTQTNIQSGKQQVFYQQSLIKSPTQSQNIQIKRIVNTSNYPCKVKIIKKINQPQHLKQTQQGDNQISSTKNNSMTPKGHHSLLGIKTVDKSVAEPVVQPPSLMLKDPLKENEDPPTIYIID